VTPIGDDPYETFVATAHVGVVLTDLDGTVTAVNSSLCRLWGLSEGDLVGSSGLELVHPDDRVKSRLVMSQLINGDVDEIQAERRYVRPDGSVVWAETATRLVRNDKGAPRYFQSELIDISDRHQAEDARRWLEDVVQSSQDAIIGTTLDGTILNWNTGAQRIFGFTSEEMLGHDASVLRQAHSEGEIESLISRIHRGELIEHRVVRVRKDGSLVTLLANSSPIRDSAGAVVGTVTVARDLAEIEKVDAMFRSLLDAAPDAMVCVNANGVIALVNAQAESLFGYSRDEMIGQPVEMLVPDRLKHVHPLRRSEYVAHPVPRAMGAGRDLAARRKDGSEFFAEISLSSIRTEEGPLISATIRDGTERRQAAIVASSADAVISRGLDGTITSWNAAAEKLYGYSSEEAVGHQLDSLFPHGHSEEVIELTERFRRGEPVDHYETQRVRKDGVTLDISISLSPVRDVTGEVVGTSSVARDITERKRVAAEREQMAERLRQSERLESLGQLAGGVAHDFNNLLGAILNYASLVANGTASNPQLSADVEQIRAAAERAARLTQQLLIVGRRETIRPELLQLNGIVNDLHELLSRTISENIEFVLDLADALPEIEFDRGQIEQVLLNLVVNARDAMPFGGTLSIGTALVDLDEDFVRTRPELSEGRHVELLVSDTGVGIAPEITSHIFEPFFTTKPKGSGTGLGLATVYGIVTAVGGGVSVYSEQGIGTTFRVLVPAALQSGTLPEVPTDLVDLVGHGETILLVEDEPSLLESTARILRLYGYLVHEASNATLAVAVAQESDIQLLLTDSVMPLMSGRILADRIGEIRPDVPVLFMSGYSHGVTGPQRLIREDATLLQKPFSIESLLMYVQRAIAGRTEPNN
jgi:PAS domain S-box-containing protein